MPNKQVRQLVSKTESGEDLLGHFPQEISLQEFIRGGLGRAGQETRNLVTLLDRTLLKNMMEWIPKKETFELVENCFSTVKPLQRLDETGYTNTGDTESEDRDEETSDLEEYEEEIDVQSNHETRNETWLKEDFFPCRKEANGSWSSGGAKLLNMDVSMQNLCIKIKILYIDRDQYSDLILIKILFIFKCLNLALLIQNLLF